MRPTKSFVLRAMTMQISKIFCYFQSFPENSASIKQNLSQSVIKLSRLCLVFYAKNGTFLQHLFAKYVAKISETICLMH